MEHLAESLRFFCFVAMTLSTTVGLVAVWAAVSRRHWFARACVVGAVLLLWTPFAAYDLILLYFVQCVVVVAGVRGGMALARRKDSPSASVAESAAESAPATAASGHDSPDHRGRFRFSLTDAMLATLIAAVVVAVGVKAPTSIADFWIPYSKIGLCFGVTTLSAAWLALGRRWWFLRLLVLLVVAPVSGWPMNYDNTNHQIALLVPEFQIRATHWASGAALLGVAWLALARRLLPRSRPAHAPTPADDALPTSARERRMRCTGAVAWGLLTLVLIVPPALTYAWIFPSRPIPEVTLPDPNGYDELIRIGKSLKDVADPILDDGSHDERRAFAGKYQTELEQLRVALDVPTLVPLDYQELWPPLFDNMAMVRTLANLCLADATVAAQDGRDQDARQGYHNVWRMADAISNGGLIFDYLVADGFVRVTVSEMSATMHQWDNPEVDAATMRQYVQEMETPIEPIEELIPRDRAWHENPQTWDSRLWSRLEIFVFKDQTDNLKRAENVRQARARLLLCQWALRRFRVQHGRLPDQLAEVVPTFLTQVPSDPLGTGPLKYHKVSESKYRLYSVGKDGRDDLGLPDPFGDLDDLMLEVDPALDKTPQEETQ